MQSGFLKRICRRGKASHMKNRRHLPLILFSLSLPVTYLAVSFSPTITQYSALQTMRFPVVIMALSIGLLFVSALIFAKIFKRRHASILRMIVASFATVLFSYGSLAVFETTIIRALFSSDITPSGIFMNQLSLYLSFFSAPAILTSLLAIYLTRSISEKMENEKMSELFS